MKRTVVKIVFFVLLLAGFALLARVADLTVLDPKGFIALRERNLMVVVTLLMLIVVVPVFLLLVAISWRYRAGNTKAKYTPDWEHNFFEEFVWWAIPIAIIGVVAVITWKSTHELDPYKPLAGSVPPVTIQVVALDWKWLFIYPAQGIATVNYVEIPENTPINFAVTSDAPMNSLWIPQLSGQIYAMPGMVTQLHIIADGEATYDGLSSNFSGDGFSGMTFKVRSVSRDDFTAWVARARQASSTLNWDTYQMLARPSQHVPVRYYSPVQDGLYTALVMQYMLPTGTNPALPLPALPMPSMASSTMSAMPGMAM